MQAWESPIIRVTTGRLNTVDDLVIAGGPSIGSRSRYGGQLGKSVFYSSEQISTMFDSSVGTLYTGAYQYVKRRASDPDSPALAAGKLAFWDTTATSWESAFQVTTDENLDGQANAVIRAGVFIGHITPGQYGFIQWFGEASLRFRTVLTTAGAVGSPVYAAAAGDTGADQGTADVLTTDSTAAANERWLGWAVTAPTAGGLKKVLLANDAFMRIG